MARSAHRLLYAFLMRRQHVRRSRYLTDCTMPNMMEVYSILLVTPYVRNTGIPLQTSQVQPALSRKRMLLVRCQWADRKSQPCLPMTTSLWHVSILLMSTTSSVAGRICRISSSASPMLPTAPVSMLMVFWSLIISGMANLCLCGCQTL